MQKDNASGLDPKATLKGAKKSVDAGSSVKSPTSSRVKSRRGGTSKNLSIHDASRSMSPTTPDEMAQNKQINMADVRKSLSKDESAKKKKCIQKLMQPCIFAKFQFQNPRPGSAISIQEPNKVEISRCKKRMKGEHPLLLEKPETWNNIPICLTLALTNILNHIVESDNELFDYQMKNNERIWMLQEQITKHKKRAEQDRDRFTREIESRLRLSAEAQQVKFTEVESSVRSSTSSSDAVRLGLKKIQNQLNGKFKKVEEDQTQITKQLAEFELITKDALVTLEENLINYNKLVMKKFDTRISIEQTPEISTKELNVESMKSSQQKLKEVIVQDAQEDEDTEKSQKDDQEAAAAKPVEEKPPVPQVQVVRTDLKDYMLCKFNTLEPKIDQQFDDLQTKIAKLEQDFQERLFSQNEQTTESMQKQFQEVEIKTQNLSEFDENIEKKLMAQREQLEWQIKEVVNQIQIQQAAAMTMAMEEESDGGGEGGPSKNSSPMGKKQAAKQKQQIQMIMAQVETIKSNNIPAAMKKVETKIDDQMIMIKGMISNKIKKLEKQLPEIIVKHIPSTSRSKSKRKGGSSAHQSMQQDSIHTQDQAEEAKNIKNSKNSGEVNMRQKNEDGELVVVHILEDPKTPTSNSQYERSAIVSQSVDHASSTGGDNDEYTRMLIRQEIEKKMEDIDTKIQSIVQELNANQLTVGQSVGTQEENPALEDLETKVDQNYQEIQGQIIKILAQMKIIRMVQQCKPAANKSKEEELVVPEFNNYSKTIDEGQLATEYTNMPGNRFDRGLNKMLKTYQSKRDGSPDKMETGRSQNSPSKDHQAPLWPKKLMQTTETTRSQRRSPKNKSKGSKEKMKQNRDQFTNYLREIPKGLSSTNQAHPLGATVIVNTAYKGQKTVQSQIAATQLSQSSAHNEFESNSLGNMTIFNFPPGPGKEAKRYDGILRLPVSMLSQSRDEPPITDTGRSRYIQSNNQYGVKRGPKVSTLPGTAGNVGIGSLGSPHIGHFDQLSNSNEMHQDSRGLRILSPGLNKDILVSPMGMPSSFRGRNSSTTAAGAVKLRNVQQRANLLNSIEYNTKFEDLGL